MTGRVVSLSRSAAHGFSKQVEREIRLLEGHGVEGDAHAGVTAKHRSRVARDPTQPNLRQVHLIHGELLDELNAAGFDVAPGDLGENILMRGVDLLGLATGACLHIGETAVVEVTGLRNPCGQIEAFRPGLLAACVGRTADGRIVRKAGVMGIVVAGGVVRVGDAVRIIAPAGEFKALLPV